MTCCDGEVLHAIDPYRSYNRQPYNGPTGLWRTDISRFSLVVPGKKEIRKVEVFDRKFCIKPSTSSVAGNINYAPHNITAANFMNDAKLLKTYTQTITDCNVNCSALTNAGSISGGDTFCESGNPSNISNVTAASGGSGGTIEYIWQRRNRAQCSTGAYSNWTTINGATTASYDFPNSISWDHQFRRGAKRSSCGNYVYSNIVTFDVTNPLTNAGSISGGGSYDGNISGQTLSGTAAAGGCGGNIQYQWQYRVREVCANTWGNWTNWSGKTTQNATWGGSCLLYTSPSPRD